MSESEGRYSVQVWENAKGRFTWSVSSSNAKEYPLRHDYGAGYGVDVPETSGECKTFAKAMDRAVEEVAHYVKRDLRAELVDSFESNTPIAQGGTA